jgi:peptide/nickel transport system substrate-binding protein
MSEQQSKLTKACSLARAGRISRRDFHQLAIAAGLTLATADALFLSEAKAQPKKGGTFRVGVGSGATTDTLDPATWPDTFNGLFGWGTLGASLTEVEPDGKVIGDAAESFEASEDAKAWVFRLRKGAEFHDGKSLTADDVVASINHHRGAESKSAAKSLLKPVVDVKADGKDVVVVTLDSGNADFPYIASDYHLPILPSKDGKANWQDGIGLGPYKKTAFDPGVRGAATRFENFYKPANFDEVEILTIIDVAARTNALTSGDVNFIDRVDLKTVAQLKRNPRIKIAEVAGFAHYVAPMDCRAKPFDNNDVRLALKYAIDRQQIVDKVLLGHGSPGYDNPIAQGVPYAVVPKSKHAYDPEKAKFHLKKAGLSELKVDLSSSDAAFAGAVDAAQLMADSARGAGITINVVREPGDAYWDNVWMKKPWCLSYWSGRPTADLMFTTAYQTGAAWNDSFWSNAKFDKLLVEARSELDPAKRGPMYDEMQNIVADDGGVAVLMFYNYVNAHDGKVQHGPIAANWDVDGLKVTRRWWFG